MNENLKKAKQSPEILEASRILDAALELASEQDNWYDLSLMDLARRCGMPVNGVRYYYADTNAIADAWFSRALEAMLSSESGYIETLPVKERLEFIIWRWFESLAPYRRITAQMLGAKLHPPHVHHWVPMAFDLSRLVQLWRDAAGLHAGGRRRQVEEIALTGIFLATLRAWCSDESSQQTQAHSLLLKLLVKAENASEFWFPAKRIETGFTERKA